MAWNLAFVTDDREHKAEDGEDCRQEVEVSHLIKDFIIISLGARLLFLDLPAVSKLLIVSLPEPNHCWNPLSFE